MTGQTLEDIGKTLEILQTDKELDFIFAPGTPHSNRFNTKHDFLHTAKNATSLLLIMRDQLGMFNGTGTTVMVAGQADWKAMDRLRLDSQLYYYDISTAGIQIFEVYSVIRGPQIHKPVAIWNETLTWLVPIAWQVRRSDFMGAEIRNGLKFWSHYNNLVMGGNDGTEVVASSGVYAEIMSRLAEKLNFTQKIIPSRYTYIFPLFYYCSTVLNRELFRDNKWGGVESDGKTWNGLVGMLIDDEVDMASAGHSFTYGRSQVVDLSLATGQQVGTLMGPRAKGRATQFWVYLDIFPIHVWIVCIASIICLAVGFYLLTRVSEHESFSPSLLNSFALVSLLVLQLDNGSAAKFRNTSFKMLYMTAAFLAYLIFTYYTCDLTARMTSGPPALNIR